ncbi:Cmr2p RNJ42_04461 [Nakaseomyces bracarensis]|uniref:Cmr2p n=1 Tax=Nakaseomyces bracarensis TaxID=273131 RepID=UPI003871F67B
MEGKPDFSIPASLPVGVQYQLNELIQDYKQENLTLKGYRTKRTQLLENYELNAIPSNSSFTSSNYSNIKSTTDLSPSNIQRPSPAFNDYGEYSTPTKEKRPSNYRSHLRSASTNDAHSRDSRDTSKPTPISSIRHSSVYRVTTLNSSSRNSIKSSSPAKFKKRSQYSLTSSMDNSSISGTSDKNSSYNPMIPLLPRKPAYDDADSKEIDMLMQESLPAILRRRFELFSGQTAIISINLKGKETYITWDKLYLRAEKVAYELNKERIYKMDKVLLWYNMEDTVEFCVALMGCFIAGMVAVPISFQTYPLSDIIDIIKITSSKLVLISNNCHKQLDNLHSTTNHNKVKLVKSEVFNNVKFIKTDDLGVYSKAKKKTPIFETPNIMYIEFTRTPLGRLSGVVMKHKVLMNQFGIFSRILNSRTMPHWKRKTNVITPLKAKQFTVTSHTLDRFVQLNSLNPTRSTGLIFGFLFNVFSGNLLISVDNQILQNPGGYEHVIDKYRADILLNDQLQLKQVVINYLENPELTLSKKHKIDFSCIKYCLTSCTTIDTEVTDMVIHKWLKNLGCIDASMCYSPMLTLSDFGGVFFSLKDQIGNLENFPIHNTKLRLQDDLFVNRERLKKNIIEPSITAMINSSSSFRDYLKIESFGFPIPGSTLCVVDPDDNTLVDDLTVGEIWVSSDFLTDEFYELDRINDFVFKAKLNYNKMFAMAKNEEGEVYGDFKDSMERVETIYNICPRNVQFLRTKLIGFVFNGKVYVLSLVEDMFLQNKLIRLPNWAHTSDLSQAKQHKHSNSRSSLDSQSLTQSAETIKDLEQNKKQVKRVVESHYLQQITETLVRTVNTIFEAVAFELNHHKEEHFLVLVVESSLARDPRRDANEADSKLLVTSNKQKYQLEKKMNELSDQIYRILWIFHKVQPMCILVVPRNTLPRRYCSLEIATSTVVKLFYSGKLDAQFVKFQFDNVILDFIPHSSYYNESIFSEHLSKLRNKALRDLDNSHSYSLPKSPIWQASGINFVEYATDNRTGTKMKDFNTILDVLEYRISKYPNDLAFSDGGNSTKASSNNTNSNNLHKKVSWKNFEIILASFLKKIAVSKTPLKAMDCVIIMCENSVEYIAMTIACFYCNLVVIPMPVLSAENINKYFDIFISVIKGYKVKRIFTDSKTFSVLDSNPLVSKTLKRNKNILPKITVFSKVKKKNNLTINMFKKLLREKFSLRGKKSNTTTPCFVWVDVDGDIKKNIHSTMNHATFLNTCKIVKETLHLTNERNIFSIAHNTSILGFLINNLLGIFVGCATNLFNIDDIKSDANDFLLGLQNLSIREIYLPLTTLYTIMDRANNILENTRNTTANMKKNANNQSSILRSDFLRNISKIMIPFEGRPNTVAIESILKRFSNIMINQSQICYIYQHPFNPFITIQSGGDDFAKDLYLDSTALREGIIDEVSRDELNEDCIRMQSSGSVPICTDVTIVNPETQLPCIDGEYGEIWCCSEANVHGYYVCDSKLKKDTFITEQFSSKLKGNADKGLTYLRTGDFGFIKEVTFVDQSGILNTKKELFVLGTVNDTIEILGLTHFVIDLERTVKDSSPFISSCYIAKMGGLLVCLIKCKERLLSKYANITALVTSMLLDRHGVILDLCAFVQVKSTKETSLSISENWSKEKNVLFRKWINEDLPIDAQFGINYGENISMYLLSEFEKG